MLYHDVMASPPERNESEEKSICTRQCYVRWVYSLGPRILRKTRGTRSPCATEHQKDTPKKRGMQQF